MGRIQKNDNFIDKTFTIIADILLKIFPASKQEKQAFAYYRDGLSAQSEGSYAEALENYYEALQIEEDSFDRSYILYNIGLIFSNTGKYSKALEYYSQALELNSNLPQAVNKNIEEVQRSSELLLKSSVSSYCNYLQKERKQEKKSCGE